MIYVINLARRPDRWKKWEKHAKEAGIENYVRWEAIDGKKLKLTEDILDLFRNNDFNFRKGVIGCALSHYEVWKQIVSTNLPSAVIFEDDARFLTKFKIPVLPEKWDLFYFGGFLTYDLHIPGNLIDQEIVIPQLPPNKVFYAFSYMLSNEGAQKLIKRVKEKAIYRAIDCWIVDAFNELNVYAFSPMITFPDPAAGTDVQNLDILMP